MSEIENWQSDLASEKHLWDAFRVSRSITAPPFNRTIRRRGYPTVGLAGTWFLWTCLNADQIRAGIEALSSVAAAATATIIGFLVAGLAIFTTLSDKKLLVELAKTRQRGSDISSFKYVYYNLLATFVVYISALVSFCIVYVGAVMKVEVGFGEIWGVIFPWATIVNGAVLIAIVIVSSECIMRLKSFIWNLYSSFISLLVAWEFLQENDGESAASPNSG